VADAVDEGLVGRPAIRPNTRGAVTLVDPSAEGFRTAIVRASAESSCGIAAREVPRKQKADLDVPALKG